MYIGIQVTPFFLPQKPVWPWPYRPYHCHRPVSIRSIQIMVVIVVLDCVHASGLISVCVYVLLFMGCVLLSVGFMCSFK